MAVAYVQDIGFSANGQSSTSASLTGVTAGNFLAMVVNIYTTDPTNQPGTADDNGNTWAATTGATNGTERSYIDYAEDVNAGDTEATFDQATNAYSTVGSFAEFSGVVTSSSFNLEKGATGTSTTPSTGTSGTIAEADSLVLACMASDIFDASAGIDLPSGFTSLHTEQDGSSFWAGSCDYKITTATGTQEAAWGTLDGSAAWSAFLAVFKGTGSGATDYEGTGALAAQAAAVSGSGLHGRVSTGALAAQAAAVAGTGVVGRVGAGSLTAQAAAVAGTGVVGRTGSGALTVQAATVAGTGTVGRAGSGTIIAGDASVSGTGHVNRTATGALQAQDAAVSGDGTFSGAPEVVPTARVHDWRRFIN